VVSRPGLEPGTRWL